MGSQCDVPITMPNESAISLLPFTLKKAGVPSCMAGHSALARRRNSSLKISL